MIDREQMIQELVEFEINALFTELIALSTAGMMAVLDEMTTEEIREKYLTLGGGHELH
jgi:hypothetical protein